MVKIVDTIFYSRVLKELNYSFGDFYIFEKFIVSEIKEGVNFDYSNARKIINDVCDFLGTQNGEKINFISNRVNSYSVVASDWLKFYKNSYRLKSYIVVSDSPRLSNSTIEKLFFKGTIKHFKELDVAINFVENDMIEIT
ncbi:hypothetical protein [Algibacter sp. Ld11]|uniref:hypothetical protein n=1 Tax=Algibacter sp. Ld11 TaxID=649150 RepID=UPI00386764C1